MWVEIAEWICLAVAVSLILAGVVFIRRLVAAQAGTTYTVLSTNALYVLATIGVVLGGYSPLHLLWLFPIAFFAGFLSMAPPFNGVLVPLGKAYATVCCIGVKKTTPPEAPGN